MQVWFLSTFFFSHAIKHNYLDLLSIIREFSFSLSQNLILISSHHACNFISFIRRDRIVIVAVLIINLFLLFSPNSKINASRALKHWLLARSHKQLNSFFAGRVRTNRTRGWKRRKASSIVGLGLSRSHTCARFVAPSSSIARHFFPFAGAHRKKNKQEKQHKNQVYLFSVGCCMPARFFHRKMLFSCTSTVHFFVRG